MKEEVTYQSFVEYSVLNNKIQYVELPYNLRTENLGLFYYAIRAARDHLRDATQYVCVMEQFLTDIDQLEKQGEVNNRLRRRACDAIVGVDSIFKGIQAYDVFLRKQQISRPWLFSPSLT